MWAGSDDGDRKNYLKFERRQRIETAIVRILLIVAIVIIISALLS
jgi:hypothetical protein